MNLKTRSEVETENCGEALASKLRPGDVVALYGEPGADKIAFVRGLAGNMQRKRA